MVNTLSHGDIENLFSGAPNFSVQTYLQQQRQPQVTFSEDATLDISDVNDHTMLEHPSFSVCTLHPHLPPPDDNGNGIGRRYGPNEHEGWSTAGFNVGALEVPNMLEAQGKERGTVGWGHFLQLPAADILRTSRDDELQQGQSLDDGRSSDGTRTDFAQGSETWLRIGLRDIRMEVIVERLREIIRVHQVGMEEMPNETILGQKTPKELYTDLFMNLLYPSDSDTGVDAQDPHSLKVQLESLVTVLGAKGIWIDFSLVEWRIRLGQLLWTTSDTTDEDEALSSDGRYLDSFIKRKRLLLQILLSCELLVRLDAIAKSEISQVSELDITSDDVRHFHKLRSRKVDWDLILARRFLENIRVKEHQVASPSSLLTPAAQDPAAKSVLFPQKLDNPSVDHDQPGKEVDAVLLPRHPQRQLSGLLHFAKAISWPHLDVFTNHMTNKVIPPSSVASSPTDSIYATPLATPLSTRSIGNSYFALNSRPRAHRQNTQRSVRLHRPQSMVGAEAESIGGWLSHSWLTGLVLPGEAASHYLISTLLENDLNAVKSLGDSANLYGGFVYGGKSWWSKACVVGRVLAGLEGSSECMGWIFTKVTPRYGSEETMRDGWVDAYTQTVTAKGKPRIEEGARVSQESLIMGSGRKYSNALSEDFILPVDEDSLASLSVKLERLVLLSSNDGTDTEEGADVDEAELDFSSSIASVTFVLHHHSRTSEEHTSVQTATFILSHDVQYITSFPCHLPRGRSLGHLMPPSLPPAPLKGGDRLPGHLLHKSYRYCHKSLADLDGASPPSMSEDQPPEIWIIDSRSGPDAEALARGWCAERGQHAIISRTTRTCIGCSVREANAIGVNIVIRV